MRIPSRFANIYYVRKGSYIICCGFCDEAEAEDEDEDAILIRRGTLIFYTTMIFN